MDRRRRPFLPAALAVLVSASLVGVFVADFPSKAGASQSQSLTVSPTPSLGYSSGLHDVSCYAPNGCMAVGAYDATQDSPVRPLIERWNGSKWSIVAAPSFAAMYLDVISCPSARFCMVLGGFGATTSRLVAEVWSGSAWTAVTVPDPAGIDPVPNSVSCVTSNDCVAVGFDYRKNARTSFSEIWNGVKWRVVPSINPFSTLNELSGVACTSATSCQAVGQGIGKLGPQQLIEAWNGRAWAVVPTPTEPFYLGQELTGISCATPTSCVAVGTSEAPRGNTMLFDSWNGTAWSDSSSAGPGIPYGNLLGVSCPSEDFCLTVGIQSTGQSLAAVWNGASWFDIPSANPAGSALNLLAGVSCAKSMECQSVGSGTKNSGASDFTLAEREAG